MKIYFVRHGETDMNKNNMFYGWYDADINEKGVSQAEDLREAFKDIHIDKIYSSDLTRAAHTAEIIADGRSVELVPDLREMAYGICEENLLYQLNDSDLTPDYPLGVSNEFIGKKATVSVKKGKICVIWNGKHGKWLIGG